MRWFRCQETEGGPRRVMRACDFAGFVDAEDALCCAVDVGIVRVALGQVLFG